MANLFTFCTIRDSVSSRIGQHRRSPGSSAANSIARRVRPLLELVLLNAASDGYND